MASIFETNPVNTLFNSPTENVITLVAGYPNSGTKGMDENLCKELKECYFNAAIASITQNDVEGSLTNCYNNGLKLFVHNSNLFSHTKSFVTQFKDKEGLGGWLLSLEHREGDEITASGNIYQLSEVSKQILDLAPNVPVFIGLTGAWNFLSAQGNVYSYPDYIAEFQNLYHPSFWPYIYYPDLMDKGAKDIDKSRIINFWKSLQYFSYISRYTCAPFWAFCRCQQLTDYNGYNAPKPTLRRIRGTVFASLAYGAQGIVYWNYRQQTAQSSGNYIYSNAPINTNGSKTDTWSMIQTVNKEVMAYSKIFYGCEVIDCRHLTTMDNPEWIKKLTNPIGPLEQVLTEKINLLVSHINKDGKDFLVIVFDPFNNTNDTSSTLLNLKFNKYWNVNEIIFKYSNIWDQKIINYNYTKTVSPGDYLIFTWQ